MKKHRTTQINYGGRLKHNKFMLLVEILCVLGITLTVASAVWSGVHRDARQSATKLISDYEDITQGYISLFETMLVPIEEKIKEDLPFEEMQSWLQSNEEQYTQAIGADIYDGIAFTYKGGYAHSWNYGEYSDYDPATRPWYQEAQKANGKVTVVAPYVTYLDPSYLTDDGYILMTIAQKYNEEISFDLDLKINGIKDMLSGRDVKYENEKVFLYDKDGYILSTTEEAEFAHNLYTPDQEIGEAYSETVKYNEGETDKLLLGWMDGKVQYMYFHQDDKGNTVCILIPFMEVFAKNFFVLLCISVLMILLACYLYFQNKKNTVEFMERDRRLSVVSDTIYSERLYVDVDNLEFYGNDKAGNLCKNGTYEELYQLIQSRIVLEKDLPRLKAFLSQEELKNTVNRQYVIDTERFLMKMADQSGNLKDKTIDMSRLAFTRNKAHMVGISMRDASESADLLKEALEAANRASVSKGNFLSNMSHEIRTPLNAIIGYITIAKDKNCTAEKKDYCIENCDTASRHLLQIINDVLDMSSIENGKLKIAHEEFDLKKEITDITSIFFQNAKIKNVNFETHIENLTEEWVIGDQLRLNQVLMNLLSNAVKFTPENGKIQLKVEQLRKDDAKVYMKFQVSDTGIGMSEEYMSRIFRPFEQENAGTARKFGGSGLGLSITNNLVNMMGGKIEVTSRQEEGTTFVVTMFFDRIKENHDKNIQADYSSIRVLIVDDQKDECTYVKTMLKRCGVKADIANSGEKAIRQIRSRMGGDYAYDLCILDWNMPEMNGVEVTKRIRRELGEEMPIIIATAYDISQLEDEAKNAGVNKIVSKPLFQSTLFDLLVSTFGSYAPQISSENPDQKIDMSGVRVLLAEDNPMNMDIAVTILEKAGISVTQAVNGEEACEKFLSSASGSFDMILMDVQMPVMDGYEATKQIRHSEHPEAKTIPIIAMTANAFAEDVAEALSKGMDAHIAKPINYDKLFELLKKYVNR